MHKTIVALIGEAKHMKKLNNGTLQIEVINSKQAKNLLKLNKIADISVTVTPHRTLNHSRGVISESVLQRDIEEDLLDSKAKKLSQFAEYLLKEMVKISEPNT